MKIRLSSDQQRYLEFVASHPHCKIADVVGACKHNPLAGHKWVYDGVRRLRDRGLLLSVKDGTAIRLDVTDHMATRGVLLAQGVSI